MNHLEAFLSDDAKDGRVWLSSMNDSQWRRFENFLQYKPRGGHDWKICDGQVAAMLGECRWADEPKTLTPQEALRALADGKVLRDEDVTVFVGFDGTFRGPNKDGVEGPVTIHRIGGFRIVDAPSQPAEPQLSSCSCMGDASCLCRRARIVDGGK